MRRVQVAGGFCLLRAKAGRHPQVLEAFRDDGTRLCSRRHTSLQTIHATLPTRQRVALVVPWHVDGCPLSLRLLLTWHCRTQSFCSLLTNLAPQRSPLDTICRAYTWRWQVELLWKEGPSSANLPAFATANPALVEGVLWPAIAAAALKRFLAHMPPLLTAVPMSTRKGAMYALHVLDDVVAALKSGDEAALYAALEAAITYLACHARRAYPARDRQTGRSQ